MEAPQAGGGESVTSPRILSVTVKIPVLRVGFALPRSQRDGTRGIGGSKGNAYLPRCPGGGSPSKGRISSSIPGEIPDELWLGSVIHPVPEDM